MKKMILKKPVYYYKKCIEIKKNNHYLSRAMANLAQLYDEAGNTDSAIKYYEKSIEIDKEVKNYNGFIFKRPSSYQKFIHRKTAQNLLNI